MPSPEQALFSHRQVPETTRAAATAFEPQCRALSVSVLRALRHASQAPGGVILITFQNQPVFELLSTTRIPGIYGGVEVEARGGVKLTTTQEFSVRA